MPSRLTSRTPILMIGLVSALLIGALAGAAPTMADGPQPLGTIATLAGTLGDGGPATSAFIDPYLLNSDAGGNVYVAETTSIRKIAAGTHITSTVAGTGEYGFSGDGGPAVDAAMKPTAVAVASNGDLYISDFGNSRIRKVTAATGIITTIAGTGVAGWTGDGGPATAAKIGSPGGLALNSAGDVYFADPAANVVRKVTAATGIISTVAGDGTAGYNSDNQPGVTAKLNFPISVTLDLSDNLYISDSHNSRVRKVDTNGVITTIAGTGVAGFNGDGTAKTSRLKEPAQIQYFNGFVYVADYLNQRIRRIGLASGSLFTIAGTGAVGIAGDGGPAISATLSSPIGLTVDANGISFSDDRYHIRTFPLNGNISTLAGIGVPYAGDGGPATAAVLGRYLQVATAPNGDVLIADTYNARIRKVAVATGVISTIAGNGEGKFGADGPALDIAVTPDEIAVDSAGNIYYSDAERVRKLTIATGMITTIAGTGVSAFNGDGPALSTNISIDGLEVDASGDVFIADAFANRVLKLSVATGEITTVAGTGDGTFNGDGPAATTTVTPIDLAFDSAGDLYIADFNNARIRKLTRATGMLTTLVGSGADVPNGNLLGLQTNVLPTALAIDPSGNVYFADAVTDTIRLFTLASQQVSTAAGNGLRGFSGDGGPATSARLLDPWSVALDTTGHLYIADKSNHRVRVVAVPLNTPVIPPLQPSTPAYNPVSPERLLDTREGVGAAVGKLVAGDVLALQVTGVGVTNVPVDASAVAINVTVTEPDSDGYLTVWPCGQPRPLASNLNYTRGATVPNLVIAKLGVGGTVCIVGQATTHVVADINGWFAAGPAYAPVSPERLLDTREGVGAVVGKLVAGDVLALQVTGVGVTNVPADASAVAINVTVTEPDSDGYLTVWPCGQPRPLASNLNYTRGATVPNLVIAKLGVGGTVCIVGQATTHVVADINGWFSP